MTSWNTVDARAPHQGFAARLSGWFESRAWPYVFLVPALLLVGAVILYPLASGVVLSFHNAELLRPAPPVLDISGVGAAALQIAQQVSKPIDLSGDQAGDTPVFRRRRDGEEGRGRGDDSLGLAGELQGSNRRGHAKLDDAFQRTADLEEGVHRGDGGDHGERADAKERQKETTTNAKPGEHLRIS